MTDLNKRLDNLKQKIATPEFLNNEGLANEVGIYIFPYDAKEEMTVRHFLQTLLDNPPANCNIIEKNLFSVFLDICKQRKLLDKIAPMEEKKGSAALLSALNRSVTNEHFADAIAYEPHKKGDLLLLTGVGEVFPFMRVHSLLEALQPRFLDIPIVVMYPGEYDGTSLKLFNTLAPNSYYRAFNNI